MLSDIDAAWYEVPVFTTSDLLQIAGIGDRRYQVSVQRGLLPRTCRPGYGGKRRHALADVLLVAFWRVAVDHGIPAAQATELGTVWFPATVHQVPSEIGSLLLGATTPDRAPRRLLMISDGRQWLIRGGMFPVPEGALGSTVIDMTELTKRVITMAWATIDELEIPTAREEGK